MFLCGFGIAGLPCASYGVPTEILPELRPMILNRGLTADRVRSNVLSQILAIEWINRLTMLREEHVSWSIIHARSPRWVVFRS